MEAGHAVATVLVFRNAAWLPYEPPPLPVRYVEIAEKDTLGQWGGSTVRVGNLQEWLARPGEITKPLSLGPGLDHKRHLLFADSKAVFKCTNHVALRIFRTNFV